MWISKTTPKRTRNKSWSGLTEWIGNDGKRKAFYTAEELIDTTLKVVNSDKIMRPIPDIKIEAPSDERIEITVQTPDTDIAEFIPQHTDNTANLIGNFDEPEGQSNTTWVEQLEKLDLNNSDTPITLQEHEEDLIVLL